MLCGLVALPFAVGFAFADASGLGYSLEGVFFGEGFGDHEVGYFAGQGGVRRWLSVGRGAVEQEDHFAADGGAGVEGGEEFGGGAAEELFVELGEFAGEDDALGGAEDGGDVGEGVEDAVRGFVEDVGVRRVSAA